MSRAFTLIETIVYVALMGLLLTTSVLAAYQILQSSGSTSVHTIVQSEGNFLLRKIEWAIASGRDMDDATNLQITRTGLPSQISFCTSGSAILVSEAGGNPSCGDLTFTRITTDNVDVLSFTYAVDESATPKRLSVSATLKTKGGTDAPQTFVTALNLRQ